MACEQSNQHNPSEPSLAHARDTGRQNEQGIGFRLLLAVDLHVGRGIEAGLRSGGRLPDGHRAEEGRSVLPLLDEVVLELEHRLPVRTQDVLPFT